MIIQNGVQTEIKGSKLDIMCDFSTIAHTLYEEKVMTKDELMEAVRFAVLSDDERQEEVTNNIKDYLGKIMGSAIKDIFGGKDDQG